MAINIFTTTVYGACFIGWIVLFIFGFVNNGFVALGWTFFFTNACMLTMLRMQFRDTLGLSGNAVGDFVASSFLYPQALSQMVIELESENASAYVEAKHDDYKRFLP